MCTRVGWQGDWKFSTKDRSNPGLVPLHLFSRMTGFSVQLECVCVCVSECTLSAITCRRWEGSANKFPGARAPVLGSRLLQPGLVHSRVVEGVRRKEGEQERQERKKAAERVQERSGEQERDKGRDAEET